MSTAPERIRALVEPAHTAVMTMELQKGIVGDDAILPDLPAAVRDAGLLAVAGEVCRAAREHGVRVLHATLHQRADGAGQVVNSRIHALAERRRPRTLAVDDRDHRHVARADRVVALTLRRRGGRSSAGVSPGTT